MKTTRHLFFLLLFVPLLFLPVLAADAAAPADVPKIDWSTLLIPVITPVLIALVKVFAPKIPKVALPILAPVLGAALDIILHYAGAGSGGPLLGALLGAAGVCVREVLDQVKKLPQP